MDPAQLQAERRCTLTHELEHIRRGHTGGVSQREEQSVRAAAARRLIPIQALAVAILWSHDEHEVADELWVDVETVRDRLASLDAAETAYVEAVIAQVEGSA